MTENNFWFGGKNDQAISNSCMSFKFKEKNDADRLAVCYWRMSHFYH